MENRNLTLTGAEKSRYGYQGSEKDDEIKGDGNSYTTEFRQLDPRLGRWLSIDPKASAWESPYASMGNNPCIYNDLLGDTVYYFNSDGVYVKTEPNEYLNSYPDQHGIRIMDPGKIWKGQENNKFKEVLFNDSKLDLGRMDASINEYGSTKPLLFFKSTHDVAAYVQEAVVDAMNYSTARKLTYVKAQSDGGKMDYWYKYLSRELTEADLYYNGTVLNESKDARPFYIFNGSGFAFNVMDAGNFLWGREMRVLGFSYDAARASEMFNDPNDPIADQSAVRQGHSFDASYNFNKRNDPNQKRKYDPEKRQKAVARASKLK